MQCYQAQTMRIAPLANAKQNFTVSYIHTYIYIWHCIEKVKHLIFIISSNLKWFKQFLKKLSSRSQLKFLFKDNSLVKLQKIYLQIWIARSFFIKSSPKWKEWIFNSLHNIWSVNIKVWFVGSNRECPKPATLLGFIRTSHWFWKCICTSWN